jgi:hypothetical protein
VPEGVLEHVVDLVGTAQQDLGSETVEDRSHHVDENQQIGLAQQVPDGQHHRLAHVLRKQSHYPLHHKVVCLKPALLKVADNLRKQLLQLGLEQSDEGMVEGEVELNVPGSGISYLHLKRRKRSNQ